MLLVNEGGTDPREAGTAGQARHRHADMLTADQAHGRHLRVVPNVCAEGGHRRVVGLAGVRERELAHLLNRRRDRVGGLLLRDKDGEHRHRAALLDQLLEVPSTHEVAEAPEPLASSISSSTRRRQRSPRSA